MPVQKQKQGSVFEVNEMELEYGTHLINLLRSEVGKWRAADYPDTTGATRELLRYWFLNPERHATKSLFFAQREAVETAIWLNEIASRSNAGNNILNKLKDAQKISEQPDNNLPRLCFKMATGTGKTVVMAALILYHYFNRQEYRQDTRFCDYFLLVAPGITIKDRLGVLYVDNTTHNKNEASDYYRQRDLVPPKFERLLDGLNARLVITNYHAFEPRILQGNKRSVFDGKLGADGKKQEAKEESAQVIKRLLKNFKPGGRLLFINDEAHHCYLPLEKGKNTEGENTADENERAAVWFSGLREVAKRFQLRNVYDLSATPYFLNGSGYTPYTLFPWIVSDFGLTDAIENSNQVNDDFKKVFASEIRKFKEEYRLRHPDKSVENLTDADMLREVVNTVGKPGALGSHIRCVVSVSMLTEGWDANTVTHVMGLRAFGSQLLCEQVAGRALRRKQYIPLLYQETEVAGKPVWKEVPRKDEHKYKPEALVLKYPPEYAHIIGVPFKMFKGGATTPPDPVDYTTVKALPERQLEHEIIFPNLIGYKYELNGETISANFEGLPNYEVEAWRIPLRTIMGSVFTGTKEEMQVRDALDHRDQEIFYHITKDLIRLYFNDEQQGKQFHLFGQLKTIVADWYTQKVLVTGDTDQQWKKIILLHPAKQYCDAIYEGIRQGRRERGEEKVLPIFNHYNPFSSTKYIQGTTTKPCWDTTKSHVNVVVADAISTREDANFWEHVTAKVLEEMPEVESYFKNAFSDFQIPYVADGKDRHYKPDFIIRAKNREGKTILLILEITGANKQYKAEKKHFTETYWVPAVNAVRELYAELGGGEWRFLEVGGELRGLKGQILISLA